MLLPLMMTASEGRIAAVGGQHFLLTVVGAAIVHALADLQHGGGLHYFLDAGRIVDAGKLHENLVIAQAVLLNHRLGDAELVDAVADGFDRLFDGALLERVEHRRLQRRRSRSCPAPETRSYSPNWSVIERAQIAGGADIDATQGDALRIGNRIELEDVAKGDVLLLQRVLEPLDGLIGFGVDRVVYLHLKNQVGSAAQVKSEMDVLLNAGDEAVGLDGFDALLWIGSEENSPDEHDQGSEDENDFPEQVLLHGNRDRLRFLCAIVDGDRRDSIASNFNFQVIWSDTKNDAAGVGALALPDGKNDADDAPGGGYTVAGLEVGEHLLPFFLPLLLRHDEEEVEDGEDAPPSSGVKSFPRRRVAERTRNAN